MKNFTRGIPRKLQPAPREIPSPRVLNHSMSSPGVRVGMFSHSFFELQPQSASPTAHGTVAPSTPISDVPDNWADLPEEPIARTAPGDVLENISATSVSRRQWPWQSIMNKRRSPPTLCHGDHNAARRSNTIQKKTLPASSVVYTPQTQLTKSRSAPSLKPCRNANHMGHRQKPLPPLPVSLDQSTPTSMDEEFGPRDTSLDGEMYVMSAVDADGEEVFFVPISQSLALKIGELRPDAEPLTKDWLSRDSTIDAITIADA